MPTNNSSLNDVLMILGRNNLLTGKEYAIVTYFNSIGVDISECDNEEFINSSEFKEIHSNNIMAILQMDGRPVSKFLHDLRIKAMNETQLFYPFVSVTNINRGQK